MSEVDEGIANAKRVSSISHVWTILDLLAVVAEVCICG